MNNYELPKPYTQEDQDAKDIKTLQEGSDREKALIWLRAFSTQRRLPKTADYQKIVRDATDEFRQNNFSDAFYYIETLGELVEHYEALAQNYADQLVGYGTVLNEYGEVVEEPVAIVDQDGEDLFSRVEVIVFEEHDREDIWYDYIKPRLGNLTWREEQWVADNFPEQLKQENDA